jgi:hypothetical protein
MSLRDVTAQEQFSELYRSNGLESVEDKIRYLTSAMKIRATRMEGKETPEEELDGLEELALLGYWRASW